MQFRENQVRTGFYQNFERSLFFSASSCTNFISNFIRYNSVCPWFPARPKVSICKSFSRDQTIPHQCYSATCRRQCLQYPITTRSTIGGFSQKWKTCLPYAAKRINNDKKNGCLCRFYLYTQPFFNGIVKERFISVRSGIYV